MKTPCGSSNYIAPEVIGEPFYGEECDIWSLGVIAFLLLWGYFPFEGSNLVEIYENIQRNEVRFEESQWELVSQEAKDLILNCLNKDKNSRISAEDALKSTWLSETQKFTEKTLSKEIVKSLKSYKASSILKREALSLLVKLLEEDRIKDLKEVFTNIDTNCSGSICSDELSAALKDSGNQIKSSKIK